MKNIVQKIAIVALFAIAAPVYSMGRISSLLCNKGMVVGFVPLVAALGKREEAKPVKRWSQYVTPFEETQLKHKTTMTFNIETRCKTDMCRDILALIKRNISASPCADGSFETVVRDVYNGYQDLYLDEYVCKRDRNKDRPEGLIEKIVRGVYYNWSDASKVKYLHEDYRNALMGNIYGSSDNYHEALLDIQSRKQSSVYAKEFTCDLVDIDMTLHPRSWFSQVKDLLGTPAPDATTTVTLHLLADTQSKDPQFAYEFSHARLLEKVLEKSDAHATHTISYPGYTIKAPVVTE